MKLQRAWNDGGTAFGILRDDEGRVFFTTVEGKPIAAGTYTVRRVVRPIHGECFEVQNVPKRSGILFHSGNTEADTVGCIVVGFGFMLFVGGNKPDAWGVTDSRRAVQRFKRFTAKLDTFQLVVSDPS